MLEIGSVLDGKYKILNEIGHGGMSVVYLAINERANKTWAVKEVRKDGGNDSEVVSQGLVAETEMLKKLNHPNLPSIVDVIDKSDTFIIVMDYIEGRSLQSVLNHNGAQDPERVLEWSKQLCDVLGYLHSRHPAIIYRDMKPANVMLRPDGQVALIDFGTAREYKEHSQGDTTWLGTRGYAAPEQFGGRGQTDARTDIYCLGATMYHLLTGYSPADTQFVIYPLGELVPELAGSGLEKVVSKCCEPDPAKRYQNCAELMYALEHVHDEDAIAIRDRSRKWKLFIASCIIALIGLMGIIGFSITYKVAQNRSVDQKLYEAASKPTYQEIEEAYAEVADIKPEDPRSYNLLLDTITDPGSDEGEMISSGEQALMDDVFSRNKEAFWRGSRSDYLDFQYYRGKKYFSLFNGNKKVTKSILDDIKEDDKLGEERQKIANCLSLFCDIYIINETRQTNTSGDGSSVKLTDLDSDSSVSVDAYRQLWDSIQAIISDEKAIDEIIGDQQIATMMYREIAKQIQHYQTRYESAGVTKEEMLELLEIGKNYLPGVDTKGNEAFAQLVREAEEEIEMAETQLRQNKKTDLGAGTTPDTPNNTAADTADSE